MQPSKGTHVLAAGPIELWWRAAWGAGSRASLHLLAERCTALRGRRGHQGAGLRHCQLSTGLLLFFLPISVVQYVPNFYFGALLMVFGIEILFDWLIAPFGRVGRAEYVLLWATFLAIVNTNLEVGIAAGIVAATLYFAYAYAKVHVTAFTVVPCRSGVVRSAKQRAVLELMSGRMAAISLSGYIFFGSSITISHKVAAVADEMLSRHDDEAEKQGGLCRTQRLAAAASKMLEDEMLRPRVQATLAHAPCFILLDLRGMQGLDATAAQTFGTMWNSLQRRGVELVLTHMDRGSTGRLLAAHGITSAAGDPKSLQEGSCRSFDSLEEGTQYCEERLLEIAVAHKLCRPQGKRMTLEETLQSHADLQQYDLQASMDLGQVAKQLREQYLHSMHYEAGDVIFSPKDPSDDIFIIEEGTVSMKTNFVSFTNQEEQPVSVSLSSGPAAFEQTPSAPDRKFEFGPGSIMGTTDFFLKRHRSYSITCNGPTDVYRLSRAALPSLSATDPQVLNFLLLIILRTSFLDSNHVVEVLERSNVAR
ncbi:hypothetical protein WJX84_006943 [Apatococcus fuscideae]|uniref:Uncharacterized protein n=1 Tax=Apatococcus fuscideae TaxID=2026836 RepID=A0AAW1TDX7_9CHLO